MVILPLNTFTYISIFLYAGIITKFINPATINLWGKWSSSLHHISRSHTSSRCRFPAYGSDGYFPEDSGGDAIEYGSICSKIFDKSHH